MYTVSDEKLIIDEYEKRGDRVKLGYHYEENIDDVYLELPMFYYPGYEVLLEDGTMLRAGLGEYNHMRIYPPYSEAESEINIRFRVSIVYGFLAIFSAVSFLVFIGLTVKKQPAK